MKRPLRDKWSWFTLARLPALIDVITGVIYPGCDLEPAICLQTANEIISKSEHRRQYATTRRERRGPVEEQRQGRLAHEGGGEQSAGVPTTLDGRFGVSRRRLI